MYSNQNATKITLAGGVYFVFIYVTLRGPEILHISTYNIPYDTYSPKGPEVRVTVQKILNSLGKFAIKCFIEHSPDLHFGTADIFLSFSHIHQMIYWWSEQTYVMIYFILAQNRKFSMLFHFIIVTIFPFSADR